MLIENTRKAVLLKLQQRGMLRDSEILALTDDDVELFGAVRRWLLDERLAESTPKGLRYIGRAEEGLVAVDFATKPRIFISYGRRDAIDIADRLEADLKALGYEVWRDTREIKPGSNWQWQITQALRESQLVIAVMTPHSTRTSNDPTSADAVDSVCLAEIAYALYNPPPLPVVPLMATTCEAPLSIYHLDFVDLRKWKEDESIFQKGFARLVNGIASAMRGEKHYRSWHHQLDPFDFAAFLHAKREGFIGRRWLCDEIDVWLTSSGREPALLIKGDPGTGKSAIVADLFYRNPNGQLLAIHCCQWDVRHTLEPWRFVRSIAAMIASRLEAFAAKLNAASLQDILSEESCRSDPSSAFERGVLAPLASLPAPEGSARYILVDALDEALLVPAGHPDLVSLLASRLDRLPPWLKVVATTRKEPAVLQRLSGLRAKEVDASSKDNLRDVRSYVRGRVESAELVELVRQAPISVDVLVEQLVRISAGNFLYVRSALDGVVQGTYHLTELDTLPPRLGGLYDQRFRSLFPTRESFAEARAVFTVVCAARRPVSRELLMEATGLGEELPRVLVALAAYLPKRPGEKAIYSVYHKSLADWLTQSDREGLVHYVSLVEGEEKLAEFCWRSWSRRRSPVTDYAVRHGVSHLLAAVRWDDAGKLLSTWLYLETRVHRGQVFGLVDDYNDSLRRLPEDHPERPTLDLFLEAIRRDVHVLAEHGKAVSPLLFQCLWNSAWWYDCPQGAALVALPPGDWKVPPPWERPRTRRRLSAIMELWRDSRERAFPGFVWLRSLRPPAIPIGAGLFAQLRGHYGSLEAVAVSFDGRYVATGAGDRLVVVWDIKSGRIVRSFEGHEDQVCDLCFTADGRLWSSALDGTLRLWDLAAGKEVRCLGPLNFAAVSMALSPNETAVFAGCNDNCLRVIEVNSGNVHCFTEETGQISSMAVAVSPDGKDALTGSGTVIQMWNVSDRSETRAYEVLSSDISHVAFSPDGKCFASGSHDGTAWVRDTASGEILFPLNRIPDSLDANNFIHSVSGIVFSADGRQIITAGNKLRIWDSKNGRLLVEFGLGYYSCLCVSRDGRYIVAGQGLEAQIWDTAKVQRKDATVAGDKACHPSPDGTRVLVFASDRTVELVNLENGRILASRSEAGGNFFKGIVWSEDSRFIAGITPEKNVRICDASTLDPLRTIDGDGQFEPSNIKFSPHGKWLVVDEHIWEISTGKSHLALEGRYSPSVTYEFDNYVFSSDEQSLLIGTFDGFLRLVNLNDGNEVSAIRVRPEGPEEFEEDILRVRLSSDNHVWLCCTNISITLWEAATGQCLHTFPINALSPFGMFYGATFSADGTMAAAFRGANGEGLQIWDVKTGRALNYGEASIDPSDETQSDSPRCWHWEGENGRIVIRSSLVGHVEIVCDSFTPVQPSPFIRSRNFFWADSYRIEGNTDLPS